MFERLTILGAGLLGGSVLWAAREKGLCRQTGAWSRRAETREACARKDWCQTVYETPEDAAREADLLLVCVPVERIATLVKQVAPHLKPTAILSDVGSTKGKICAEVPAQLTEAGAAFVGSHPMAGSEKTGIEYARADLFQGRPCFVTPVADSAPQATQQLTEFWTGLGMRVREADPGTHDAIVAHVSHLPHLVASALADALSQTPSEWAGASGPGLRDTTRVAGGDPGLWLEIVRQNREAISEALRGFSGVFAGLAQAVERGDDDAVKSVLERGQVYRKRLEGA